MKTFLFFITTAITLSSATFSNAQTLPSYLPANGLVGWWPFNGNANDESGNGNHGTVNGATFTQDRLSEIHFNNSLETIVLLKGTQHFEKSDAVLEIAKLISGAWPLLYFFKIVPRFLRDGVYTFIAKHRYQWFGKSDACLIPTEEMKAKILS